MFGAAAVRKKKQKAQQEAEKGNEPLHPYIKPFGPRFDPNELPYFKYKKALQEAQELSENIAGAAAAAAYAAKKVFFRARARRMFRLFHLSITIILELCPI